MTTTSTSAGGAGPRDQLVELVAENLGVIRRLGLVFGPGMTAITGETGAGKTLLLTALELLVGGRADVSMVGPHGDEAVVEGRFIHQGDELVLQRILPRSGRSRAYVNGRLATATSLAELGSELVELNGQHGHTALVATAAQRAALDRYCGVDLSELVERRLELRALQRRVGELGGDERERLREQGLYRFQLEEIDAVGIVDADEDQRLREEERLLAGASDHRLAGEAVGTLLGSDGPAAEALAQAISRLDPDGPFADLASRLHGLVAELSDVADDARRRAERIEADPERLVSLQERRRQLSDLRRKYGETLGDVLEYRDETARRLAELEGHDVAAAELDGQIAAVAEAITVAEAAVGAARRGAAPSLATAVTEHLRQLALPRAQLVCDVGNDPGDDVEFRVTMNAGAPLQPLSKVASGGELARTMLALRLVLSADPATMVFDEVDAGVGGAAAQAVGAALGRLGAQRQVLVVTHLAQVAAHADNHITVVKEDDDTMVSVTASVLDREARIVELSRMLSGSPGSKSARTHAAELLDEAMRARDAVVGPVRAGAQRKEHRAAQPTR